MRKHLAVFTKEGLDQILKGKKKIETRFSKKNIPPFGLVNTGDLIYLKPPGADIQGQCVVTKVISIEGMSQKDLDYIIKTYGKQISLGSKESDAEYFDKRKDSKFVTLIFIDQVEEFITPPIRPVKKDLRGWVVLS